MQQHDSVQEYVSRATVRASPAHQASHRLASIIFPTRYAPCIDAAGEEHTGPLPVLPWSPDHTITASIQTRLNTSQSSEPIPNLPANTATLAQDGNGLHSLHFLKLICKRVVAVEPCSGDAMAAA